jgi:hypothetical protein
VIIVAPFKLVSPCQCYGYFDSISVENRIWVTELELVWCDADSSSLCPVRH